jgi:hypothetical protein
LGKILIKTTYFDSAFSVEQQQDGDAVAVEEDVWSGSGSGM